MYERVSRLLIEKGARLVYTASRPVGTSLEGLFAEYPSFHYEVSTNEKVAFELAFTGAVTGKKVACILSTEGLYEALDPVMTSAYMGVVGGFLVVCIRETEEEVTPVGLFSKLPLIVTETHEALVKAIDFAFDASERHHIPFIIQATPGKGEDATTSPGGYGPLPEPQPSHFAKDPMRWAALPQSRYRLHGELNTKIELIREEFETYGGNKLTLIGRTGLITDKEPDLLESGEDTDVFHMETIFPLPTGPVRGFIDIMDRTVVSEGRYPAIELQIPDRSKVETVHSGEPKDRAKREETMYGFHVVRDKLGPASSINMAHGLKTLDPDRKVLAITFEDHFFHSGMPALVNTIYNGSSYVLLILTHKREDEISGMMEAWGLKNVFHLENTSEVERYKDARELTVLLCKGII